MGMDVNLKKLKKNAFRYAYSRRRDRRQEYAANHGDR